MASGSGTLTVPLFYTSSLTGAGVLLLHAFLKALPAGGSLASARIFGSQVHGRLLMPTPVPALPSAAALSAGLPIVTGRDADSPSAGSAPPSLETESNIGRAEAPPPHFQVLGLIPRAYRTASHRRRKQCGAGGGCRTLNQQI